MAALGRNRKYAESVKNLKIYSFGVATETEIWLTFGLRCFTQTDANHLST